MNGYQYNGKEIQDELSVGWLDYGARMNMSDIGRFFTADRYVEKYRPVSIYQYAANNPLRFVDVNGDSIDFYDNNGKLIITLSDGKKSSTGVYFQNATKNESATTSYSKGMAFGYNDEEHDRAAAKNGERTFEVVTEDYMESAMEKSGVNNIGNKAIGWAYASEQSAAGKMDYWATQALKADKIYIVQSKFGDAVGYNDSDFGNFMWGQGMRRLGFGEWTPLAAAHVNNARSGEEQNYHNPDYKHQMLDTTADQTAIWNGYRYNEEKQVGGIKTPRYHETLMARPK